MANSEQKPNRWRLFFGHGIKNAEAETRLIQLEPPPWRNFGNRTDIPLKKNKQGQEIDPRWKKLQSLAVRNKRDIERGKKFRISPTADSVINAVNAAIYLRRPLLVTGNPGSGKTSLAYAIAYELGLGPVLSWAINSRSTLQDSLYRYDAIARIQDTNFEKNSTQETKKLDIGEYIKLGALGTAFLPSLLPRVLLIDQIDKSDINLPDDLLNLFEEGEFTIPELVRSSNNQQNSDSPTSFTVYTEDEDIKVTISGGKVSCYAFPIIVITSNGERDFSSAFKRSCIRIRMPDPDRNALTEIAKAHFGKDFLDQNKEQIDYLIENFRSGSRSSGSLSTDQLLNAIYLLTQEVGEDEESIKDLLLRRLNLVD